MLIFAKKYCMIKNGFSLLALLWMMTFCCTACQAQADQAAAYQVLSITDFKTKITADSTLQLVDVRTPEEFGAGSIGNALNINYLSENFSEKIQALDKSKPVYIFCRSGNRSGKAGKIMQQLGFKEVYDLQGGYLNWR